MSMWFFGDPLFAYLKDRGTLQKIGDMVLMIAVFTWIAGIYLIATNYPAFKSVFLTSPVDMKSLVQLDRGINDILRYQMNVGGFDRASLARLHNSVIDIAGRHFVYESRSNEVVQPGVAPIATIRQNVLLSIINVWAQSFIKNECVYVLDVAKTDQFYEWFRQIGTKAEIKCPVYNTQNVWVGYVNFEYITKTPTIQEMKKLESSVRETASKIGAILSVGGVAIESKAVIPTMTMDQKTQMMAGGLQNE